MTTQVPDTVRIEGREWELCAQSHYPLFDPRAHGLNPTPSSTACYRGWLAEYEVIDRLTLRELALLHEADRATQTQGSPGPPINGVAPVAADRDLGFNCLYRDLGLLLDYTGGLLVADGFRIDLWRAASHRPIWAFEHLKELLFTRGLLCAAQDMSHIAATLRERYLVVGPFGHVQFSGEASPRQWVARAFAFDYPMVL